jgi:hypothetical protein
MAMIGCQADSATSTGASSSEWKFTVNIRVMSSARSTYRDIQ